MHKNLQTFFYSLYNFTSTAGGESRVKPGTFLFLATYAKYKSPKNSNDR